MAKIAISLPDEVLKAVEKERLGRSKVLSRSEFIKRAVEQYLRTETERTLEEQYIRGYLEHPETADESEWLDEAAAQVFANNPWGEKDPIETRAKCGGQNLPDRQAVVRGPPFAQLCLWQVRLSGDRRSGDKPG